LLIVNGGIIATGASVINVNGNLATGSINLIASKLNVNGYAETTGGGMTIDGNSELRLGPYATLRIAGQFNTLAGAKVFLEFGARLIADDSVNTANTAWTFAEQAKLIAHKETNFLGGTVTINFNFGAMVKRKVHQAFNDSVIDVVPNPTGTLVWNEVTTIPVDLGGTITTELISNTTTTNNATVEIPIVNFISYSDSPAATNPILDMSQMTGQSQLNSCHKMSNKTTQSSTAFGQPSRLSALFTLSEEPGCEPVGPSQNTNGGGVAEPFEAWKIAVIVVAAVLVIVAIVVTIVLVKRNKNQRSERARVQTRLRSTAL